MGLTVLLLSRSGLKGWWGKTCLAKREFGIRSVATYEEAFQTLGTQPVDLCVLESPPSDTGLPSFLERLRATEGIQPPPCVVVTKLEDPCLSGPPVRAVLRPPFTPPQFDENAVRLLKAATRGTTRYLVRPFYASEGISGKALGLGTTLLLTPQGMLVESSNSFPLHKDLVWTFSGVPQLRWLAVRGTISTVDAGARGTGLRRYHVDFDTGPAPERRTLLNFLDESV